MGRIQELRMARAKDRFRQEMDLNDKSRVFFVDHAGNAVGFRIERADGFVLSYNGETGRFEPFEVLPEDGAVNVPPFVFRNGKIFEVGAENTKITYVYRDDEGNKVWNACVVEGLLSEEQKEQILSCRYDVDRFIPHMVGLPEKRFDEWDERFDHLHFELFEDSFEETKLAPTVEVKAADLVEAFVKCRDAGWSESTPSLDAIIFEANGQKGTPGNFKAEVRER